MHYQDLIVQAGALIGYTLLFLIIFAESGLFFGFFLPGDSLILGLGVLASQGHLNLFLIIVIGTIAAILGDSFGYWFGSLLGHTLHNRPDSWYFRKQFFHESERYFARHGRITVVIARFAPFIRTFVPIIAGMSDMAYSTFLMFNIIGGFSWVISMGLVGYLLGRYVPGVSAHLLLIELIIVILSVLALIWHLKRTNAPHVG